MTEKLREALEVRLAVVVALEDHLFLDVHGNPVASVALARIKAAPAARYKSSAVVPCGGFAPIPTEALTASPTPSTAIPAMRSSSRRTTVFSADVPEHDGKLVSSKTHHRSPLRDVRSKNAFPCHEDRVAGASPVGLVDGGEVIEVRDGKGKRGVAVVELSLEIGHKCGAICDRCRTGRDRSSYDIYIPVIQRHVKGSSANTMCPGRTALRRKLRRPVPPEGGERWVTTSTIWRATFRRPERGTRPQACLVKMERPAPFRICVDHPPRWGGANIRKEPTVPSFAHPETIFLGLDVHRDSISVAVLHPGDRAPLTEKIFADEDSVRRLVKRFEDPRLLRACYEAGPTGYDLCRLLRQMGVACEVIAPSLIPKASGDKVKTDKRDCQRLARLHRAGELVAVRVPTPREEAVRDLCRTRGDMVEDLTRARNRLTQVLVAPLEGLPGRERLDAQARGVAGRPALRRAGPAG